MAESTTKMPAKVSLMAAERAAGTVNFQIPDARNRKLKITADMTPIKDFYLDN